MTHRKIQLADAAVLNAALYQRFLALRETDRVTRTHHLGGRYENLYIAEADIPQIIPVLDLFREEAARCLHRSMESLKAGFWFNAMEPGQRTSLHHHDENDELLSAVYYIRVPANSGELVLHAGNQRIRVTPEEGKLVLFAPALSHEVTVHTGQSLRLSVGLNAGPVQSDL